jgi:Xaa-Pro aminopeptidase
MDRKVTKYQGDERLRGLLRDAGITLSVEAVRKLVAGVLAAPQPVNQDGWMVLLAPGAGPDLRQQLAALKADMAAHLPQHFPAGPAPKSRLNDLRAELRRRGLDGFIVPRTDEHQGEYVPLRADRLHWLTGFAGSAGGAVVLADRAAIFVDGRYTLQVRDQVDLELFTPFHIAEKTAFDWIAESLPAKSALGYDPWLLTEAAVDRYRRSAERAGAALVAVEDNPVDAVWKDQPAAPLGVVVAHDMAYAGRSAEDKRARIGDVLSKEGIEAAVLTMPDSIAWLLNIRGGDVPHTPLPLSFAIVRRDRTVDLFIDPRKLSPGLAEHLGNGVSVQHPSGFGAALEALGSGGARIQAEETSAASYVFDRLKAGGAKIVNAADPCALPKACKNDVEIAGTRRAHVRDGAAVTRFLAWFAERAPAGGLREMEAAEKLRAIRFENDLIRDLSFRTISGSGPNGAIVHYSVSEATNREIGAGELYLLDSGAQYLDGTTDITRTVAVGAPTAEMRDRFTRVLKGHIAIATARFPKGTHGGQLDTLARSALWQAGLDFDHGTGHGVGSYLGVHEGPHRISKAGDAVPLQPGMIVSNEPGYYKAGAFGIRIENLVTVVPCEGVAGAERQLYAFETLTLVPIDLALVDRGLLGDSEIDWLDRYHTRVRETLTPLVDGKTATWLAASTQPLSAR